MPAESPERDPRPPRPQVRPALSLPASAHQGRRAPRRQRPGEAPRPDACWGPEGRGGDGVGTRRRRSASCTATPTRHSPSSKNDSVEHAGFGHDQPRVCQVRWSARPKNGLALSSSTKRRPAGTAGCEHDGQSADSSIVSITTEDPPGPLRATTRARSGCRVGPPSSRLRSAARVIPARPTHLS